MARRHALAGYCCIVAEHGFGYAQPTCWVTSAIKAMALSHKMLAANRLAS